MKINILKKSNENILQEKDKQYTILKSGLYITKMDLFYGGFRYLCECENIKIPFSFKLIPIEPDKLYAIKDLSEPDQNPLLFVEIYDNDGIDFD